MKEYFTKAIDSIKQNYVGYIIGGGIALILGWFFFGKTKKRGV